MVALEILLSKFGIIQIARAGKIALVRKKLYYDGVTNL